MVAMLVKLFVFLECYLTLHVDCIFMKSGICFIFYLITRNYRFCWSVLYIFTVHVLGCCQSPQCPSEGHWISWKWCRWYDKAGLSSRTRGSVQFKMSIWYKRNICKYKQLICIQTFSFRASCLVKTLTVQLLFDASYHCYYFMHLCSFYFCSRVGQCSFC